MVGDKDNPVPDVPPPSYDCAVNGANDDRVTEDSVMITPVLVEPGVNSGVDEAALNSKSLKVWLIVCVPAIAIIGFAFQYGNQENMTFVGPLVIIFFIFLLNWLRKPDQRWILLKLSERIPYIRDN